MFILKKAFIKTPIGSMIAIASETALYLLDFADKKGINQEIEKLQIVTHSTIVNGYPAPITSIEAELTHYFSGSLTIFTTPLYLTGTPFQQRVWQELQKIQYGETCSYAQIAQALGKPKAYRAVARANSANILPIIFPCHRVIHATGSLSGYSGGAERKAWLLHHEKRKTF